MTTRGWLVGTLVSGGLAGSLVATLALGEPVPPVLGSTVLAHGARALLIFLGYLFVLTVLVRGYMDGDLPVGFSLTGASYPEMAEVGAKVEEQMLELNDRLDDQARLLEVAIRQLDDRTAEIERRLP